MSELTRRRACRVGFLLFSGVSAAGCTSGSGSSGENALGESVDVDGLEITYTGYELVGELLPTTPTDESDRETSTPADETAASSDDARATPVTASGDESILGAAFRMRNAADEEKPAPMPEPAPVTARGEISVSIDTARHRQWEAPSIRVGPRAEVNGTEYGSLGHRLGQRRAKLSPGEDVSGWAFYPLPGGVEPSDVQLVISGTDFEVASGVNMLE